MFGGNSNWRGPVWMPVNALLIRALLNLYSFYGEDFKVECPTGSGQYMTLFEVSKELARRLATTFLRNDNGQRPVYGGTDKFQNDPHWRDLILFYEYFHGDNGAGLGASHQTGWTGLVARMLDLYGRLDAKDFELEIAQVSDRLMEEQVHGETDEKELAGLRPWWRPSLSLALPDQYACLADTTVPDSRPGQFDAGRRARCGLGSPGRARV